MLQVLGFSWPSPWDSTLTQRGSTPEMQVELLHHAWDIEFEIK